MRGRVWRERCARAWRSLHDDERGHFIVPYTPPSSGGVIFAADFSSAVPLAGFDGVSGEAELGVTMSRTHLPTGGPSGGPAYRFTWLHDPAQVNAGDGYGGEYYLGWGVDLGTAPTAGQSRFMRLRLRVVSGSNARTLDSSDGTASTVAMKVFIMGDGASGRPILELLCNRDASVATLRPARDGAGYGDNTITIGSWASVQMEAVAGAGGALRLWINNNTYASPDEEQTGLSMGAATWDQFGCGYYSNRMIASDGSFGLELADLEVGTAFDAAW
ncbi:hypothetical protein [Luteitalea sp.]|uniref:hypothetical protein n=1 Tax=Luteitalea sp. TaxID=2004800 RepID=UPI0025B9AFD0|nr:hypothetical protein [Luteitalea sp.]